MEKTSLSDTVPEVDPDAGTPRKRGSPRGWHNSRGDEPGVERSMPAASARSDESRSGLEDIRAKNLKLLGRKFDKKAWMYGPTSKVDNPKK
jgi:hypothetical protein